jgi:predicted nucleic acid-binding protein
MAVRCSSYGRLLAHVYRSGTQREAHDLIIAATALTSRRIILTTTAMRASANYLMSSAL